MKRIVYLLLVFMMFISICIPENIYGMTDNYNSHWAGGTLNKWVNSKYIEGYGDGTLRADDDITRAEFVKMVNRCFNYTSPAGIAFNDVKINSWYYSDIAIAVNSGYVKGISQNEFKPEDKLTREQAAAITARIKKLEDSEKGADIFVDKACISEWAVGCVGSTAEAGYVKGYEDHTFRPQKFITRAEAIVMLDRIIEVFVSDEDLEENVKYNTNEGRDRELKATSIEITGNDKVKPSESIYEYTAVVVDKNNNVMPGENVIWQMPDISGISCSIEGNKLFLKVDSFNDKIEDVDNKKGKMTSDISVLSITEKRTANILLEVDENTEAEDIKWAVNGNEFEFYGKWNENDKRYNKEPWISFAKAPIKSGNTVAASIMFDLPLNTEDPSFPRATREEITQLAGTYVLEAVDLKTGKIETVKFELKPYDSFVKYEDMKNTLESYSDMGYNFSVSAYIASNKDIKTDKSICIVPNLRYKNIESIGKSYEGNDVLFGVIAKNEEAVNHYQNKIMPLALGNPEMLIDLIKNKKTDKYQVPIMFTNPHPDESPAVDAIIKLFNTIASESKIEFNDKDGNQVVLNIDDLLDNFIFLFNFTENPDGRIKFIRDTVNDIDLNRDMAVQQAAESRILAEEYLKWNPLILWDFHGFYENKFHITPGTQPYDPNLENDMILYTAVENGYSFGDTLKANTKNDYVLVKDLYSYENKGFFGLWDTGTPSFIEVYAMLHGSLGHNAEAQSLNEESVDGLIYGSFGSINYALENKDKLFLNQLEIFRRGLAGEDNRAADKALLDEKENSEGRQRGDNDNFFPEYYVIPVDGKIQKNPLEAYHIAEYLIRNGIKLECSSEEVVFDGKIYPAGSFIVDMHQAKRGYANSVLFPGLRYEKDRGFQSIALVNLPDMNGFDVYEIREKGLFREKTERVYSVSVPSAALPQQSPYYVLKNVNNDAIRAVNKLIDKGKSVKMVTRAVTSGAITAGDFVVSHDSIKDILDLYLLELVPYNEEEYSEYTELKTIRKPNISFMNSPRYKFTLNVLEELGFDVNLVYPEDIDLSTDVVIDDYGSFDGKENAEYLKNNGIDLISISYDGFDYGARKIIGDSSVSVKNIKNPKYWQGIMKVDLNRDSVITAGYSDFEYFYLDQGRYFDKIPENSIVLFAVADDEYTFKSGQFKYVDEIKNKVIAFKTVPCDSCELPQVTVFLNWITKWYGRNMYRLLANSIYESVLE